MKLNLFFVSILMCLGISFVSAQDKKGIEFPELDKSPMDMATYPDGAAYANYLDADSPDRDPKMKVIYSRPYKKDRKVFGELLKFGEEWRLGANEGTEVTFYQDVEIDGQTISRGRYIMFADIAADHWNIKFSKQLFTAGTKNRDKTQDVLNVKVKTAKLSEVSEQFTIGFQKMDESNVHMLMQWDKTSVALPINLNAKVLDGEDKSPMDFAYFPPRSKYQNHLKPEEVEANQPKMRVLYSRPQMKGRKIFGELVKYDGMWRLGANQTTTVTFYQNVTIGGKELRRGTYGIFAKPNANQWEFIIHSNINSWGTPNHDEKDNLVSVTSSTEKTPSTLEALSVTFEDKGNEKVDIIFGWENTMARLPVTFK
jgi:hypothetical protein